VFYIQVDDPQAYLDRIEQAGGKTVVPVTVIPGLVTFAQFADPKATWSACSRAPSWAVAGPNGTRQQALAGFWEAALATLKQRAESRPRQRAGPATAMRVSSTRAGVGAKHGSHSSQEGGACRCC
jgi:hypothetical protein